MSSTTNNFQLRDPQRRLARTSVHLTVWGALAILPLLTSHDPSGTALRTLPGLVAAAMLFYLDYLWLVPRLLLGQRRIFLWAGLHVAMLGALQTGFSLWGPAMFRPPPGVEAMRGHMPQGRGAIGDDPSRFPQDPGRDEFRRPPPFGHPRAFDLVPGLVVLLAASGMGTALRLYAGLGAETRRRQEVENEFLRQELTYLRLQLSPHFLFNTLNNIYSLVQIDPQRAQVAVLDLSRMLRYQLYETDAPRVPLEMEIKSVRSYVDLMRLRLPGHVAVVLSVGEGLEGLRIAPLLFLPLIENAFKHGVHPVKPSFVEIGIRREGDGVLLSVRNSCFPKDPEADRGGSGIGTANLLKRLQLLHAGTHRYEVEADEKIHHCRLWIQGAAEST